MCAMRAMSTGGSPIFPAPPTGPARRYELDWLRALVVLGLIPFHAAVIFGATSTQGLKSAEAGPAATQIMGALAGLALLFGMPLLFLIAGAGTWFALNVRTAGQYARERVVRLLVPLIAGSLVLIPIQAYFILMSNPALIKLSGIPLAAVDTRHLDSFPQFYVQFLHGYWYFLGHYSPSAAVMFWMHLWFLPRLLAYALIALPICLYLKSPSGARVGAWLGRLSERPGGLLLFALPLAVSDIVLQPGWLTTLTRGWPIYDEWQAFFFGLLIFIYGYMVYAEPRFAAALARQGWLALLLGLAASAAVVLVTLAGKTPPYDYSPGYMVFMLLRAVGVWLLLAGIVGLAMRYLAFSNGPQRYLAEATFPLYLVHFPILTVIAFYALTWPISWLMQLLFIVLATLAVSLAVYDLLIKRVNALRVLFGMKPRRRPPGQDAGSAPPAERERGDRAHLAPSA